MPQFATIEEEIDANYEVFKERIADLIEDQRAGQYVLIRHREMIAYFATAAEAYRTGASKFPDRLYSIQEITDKPLDMGYFSHGGPYMGL